MRRAIDLRRETVFCATPPALVDATLDEVFRSPPAGARSTGPGARCLAVVHTADAVRFSATADDRDALVQMLVEYVSRQATDRLWPRDADRVRALVERGQREAAIASYFASVGQRWDKEWLITTAVLAGG